MYSRSFYPEADEKAPVPENYDGTAFLSPPPTLVENESNDVAKETSESTEVSGTLGGGILSSLGRMPILSGLFGGEHSFLKMPKIGGEEILILATAALLFFSKEGDKECALMLLFLLFIT